MTTRLLRLRSGLRLVALLLFLRPLHLSAQSSADSIQFTPAMSREAEYQVEPLGWAVPVRFRSGAPREIGSAPLILAAVRSSEGVTVPTSRLPSTLAAGCGSNERPAANSLASASRRPPLIPRYCRFNSRDSVIAAGLDVTRCCLAPWWASAVVILLG